MPDIPSTPNRPRSFVGPSSSTSQNNSISSQHEIGTSRLGSELAGLPSTPVPRSNLSGYGNRIFSTGRANPSSTSNEFSEDLVVRTTEGQHNVVQRDYLWGTNVSVVDLENDVRNFFENFRVNEDDELPYYKKLMINLSESERDLNFINVDCQHILAYSRRLYETLRDYVENAIQIFDFIASEKYENWCGVPNQLQVRPYNLGEEVAMRDLDPSDINKLVAIKGMVIRVSPILPDLNFAFFECSVCHFSLEVLPVRGRIVEPSHCENCGTNFSLDIIHNRCKFLNKQHIKLQEAPETIPAGQTPHAVVLVCLDEFKDAVQPGDRITVTGMFQASSIRPNKNQRIIKAVFKTHMEVFHIKKAEAHRVARERLAGPEEFFHDVADVHEMPDARDSLHARFHEFAASPNIYQILISSFAPGIWQHEDIKKGILCQLFGGVNKDLRDRGLGKSRGDINILLCGDPGTSKSQFLTHVNKVTPRGIYTSGKGSSSVGLTAYVSKDPVTKELVLESGALVLSDGGICCIDEFDKMSEGTRSVLHEAMEQQTISIAKAGIICTLNARASVLAAANPIGSSWNPKLPIVDNINLPPTLLSRFDLIYLILDNPDPMNDRQLARHITAMYATGPEALSAEIMPPELLARYISYAREHIHPVITDTAAEALVHAYMELRQFGGSRKTIAATPRQLESLIRISEALARMRFSSEVALGDVAEALRLIKTALCQSVTDPVTGMVDMSIITTGLSESSRQRLNQSVVSLRDYLSHRRIGAPLRLRALLEEYNQQNNANLQMHQLRDICRSLVEEGFISYNSRQDAISLIY